MNILSNLEYNNVEERLGFRQAPAQHQRLRLPNSLRLRYPPYNLGAFGKVRLVKKRSTNRYSCVKIMKKEEIIKSQQVDHINNEYRILSSIYHPFVVRFHSSRLASMDWLKTQEIYTCSWNMFLEVSSLPISENRVPSYLIRPGKNLIMVGSMQPK